MGDWGACRHWVGIFPFQWRSTYLSGPRFRLDGSILRYYPTATGDFGYFPTVGWKGWKNWNGTAETYTGALKRWWVQSSCSEMIQGEKSQGEGGEQSRNSFLDDIFIRYFLTIYSFLRSDNDWIFWQPLWIYKDNYLTINEAWAGEYWAIGVLKVVGKRRSCTGLEETATGECKRG